MGRSPIPQAVTFISKTQFSLSCQGDTTGTVVTKNWADADVVAAITAAKQ